MMKSVVLIVLKLVKKCRKFRNKLQFWFSSSAELQQVSRFFHKLPKFIDR